MQGINLSGKCKWKISRDNLKCASFLLEGNSLRKPTHASVISAKRKRNLQSKVLLSCHANHTICSCTLLAAISRNKEAGLTHQCKSCIKAWMLSKIMASKVRSMYASLASSNDQRRHRVISDRSRIEWSKYPLAICQGTLKNENRTSSQEISSSCACRHVIWIHSRSHGLNEISGEDYASHANHAIKGECRVPWLGVKVDSYEVPGGFDGSPWAWPACCCCASAWYQSAT